MWEEETTGLRMIESGCLALILGIDKEIVARVARRLIFQGLSERHYYSCNSEKTRIVRGKTVNVRLIGLSKVAAIMVIHEMKSSAKRNKWDEIARLSELVDKAMS